MRVLRNKVKRRKKKVTWLLILLFLFGFAFFFYLLGSQNGNKIEKERAEVVDKPHDSTSSGELTETEVEQETEVSQFKEPQVNELDLSDEEFKDWVRSILSVTFPGLKEGAEPGEYYFSEIDIDPSNHLATLSVSLHQTDGVGSFRVNSKGQLEAIGSIVSDLLNWYVISTGYQDTETINNPQKVLEVDVNRPKVASWEEAYQYVMANEAKWNSGNYGIQGAFSFPPSDYDHKAMRSNEIGDHYNVSIAIDEVIYPQLEQGSLTFIVYTTGRLDQQIKPTGIHFLIIIHSDSAAVGEVQNYNEIENYGFSRD